MGDFMDMLEFSFVMEGNDEMKVGRQFPFADNFDGDCPRRDDCTQENCDECHDGSEFEEA